MSSVVLWFFHSDSTKPTTLHEIDLTMRNMEFCQEVIDKYTDDGFEQCEEFYSDGLFCAGGEKGKDACNGDSGSAIFTKEKNEVIQIGLVSGSLNGISCGTEGYPTFYTRVQYYLKWILDNLEE